LIVYLHGDGEGGGHPSCAARDGLPRQVEQGLTLPWMVVSPHCPDPPQPNRPSWSEYADEVAAVVDEVRLKYPVNDTAILLTGASMGGYGTWDIRATPEPVPGPPPLRAAGKRNTAQIAAKATGIVSQARPTPTPEGSSVTTPTAVATPSSSSGSDVARWLTPRTGSSAIRHLPRSPEKPAERSAL
jgi:hypothetical protein